MPCFPLALAEGVPTLGPEFGSESGVIVGGSTRLVVIGVAVRVTVAPFAAPGSALVVTVGVGAGGRRDIPK